MTSNPEKYPITQELLESAKAADDAFMETMQGSHPLGESLGMIIEHQRKQIDLVALAIGRVESKVQAVCEAAGIEDPDFLDVDIVRPEKVSE